MALVVVRLAEQTRCVENSWWCLKGAACGQEEHRTMNGYCGKFWLMWMIIIPPIILTDNFSNVSRRLVAATPRLHKLLKALLTIAIFVMRCFCRTKTKMVYTYWLYVYGTIGHLNGIMALDVSSFRGVYSWLYEALVQAMWLSILTISGLSNNNSA